MNSCVESGIAFVVVTVLEVEGSAPRGVGTRMVVTGNKTADTIGGGALEQRAVLQCRDLISGANRNASIVSEVFTLGKSLAQCCGGRVTLQFDYHPENDFSIAIFGAGHVAQALALILNQLPCRAVFIDQREYWLNQLPLKAPGNGVLRTEQLNGNAFDVVERCPDNAYYLVMTHSHELDFELLEAILSRGDSRYCGLIASRSKARRFRARLARKQFTDAELAQLTSPIGSGFKLGNEPMAVATAAAADLLHCYATTKSKLRHVPNVGMVDH